MGRLKQVNVVRRKLMKALTKKIGNPLVDVKIDINKDTKIEKILICRPNHRLGNLLLITPLLQEVITIFPDCEIDLLVKGTLAPILFKNYPQIHKIIPLPKRPFKYPVSYLRGCLAIKKQQYDLVINVVNGSSSGKLFTKFATSRYKIFSEHDEQHCSQYSDYLHMAKNPVYSLRNSLMMPEVFESRKKMPSLDLKLTAEEIEKGKELLTEITGNAKKNICLFTFATGEKRHSEAWWLEFYDKLKTKYPDYNIIEILPMENVSQIAFKAPTFYSRELREIGAVIANTKVFIGADSGIMHLASSVKTPTVGLFMVTSTEKYQPYDNQSIAVNTTECDLEECLEMIDGILTYSSTKQSINGYGYRKLRELGRGFVSLIVSIIGF